MPVTPRIGFARTAWFILALAVLLASASCASSSIGKAATPLPTPTPAPGGGPTPITGQLGPPPTQCPQAAPLHTFNANNFGGGFTGETSFIGSAPVWQTGLPTGGVLQLAQTAPVPQLKVLWVVGPNYNAFVTVRGQNLSTGAPMSFEIYPNEAGTTSDTYTHAAQFDPATPNRGDATNSLGHWNIWGIGVQFPSAGCYELDVSWAEGSWRSIYAVGY